MLSGCLWPLGCCHTFGKLGMALAGAGMPYTIAMPKRRRDEAEAEASSLGGPGAKNCDCKDCKWLRRNPVPSLTLATGNDRTARGICRGWADMYITASIDSTQRVKCSVVFTQNNPIFLASLRNFLGLPQLGNAISTSGMVSENTGKFHDGIGDHELYVTHHRGHCIPLLRMLAGEGDAATGGDIGHLTQRGQARRALQLLDLLDEAWETWQNLDMDKITKVVGAMQRFNTPVRGEARRCGRGYKTGVRPMRQKEVNSKVRAWVCSRARASAAQQLTHCMHVHLQALQGPDVGAVVGGLFASDGCVTTERNQRGTLHGRVEITPEVPAGGGRGTAGTGIRTRPRGAAGHHQGRGHLQIFRFDEW